MRSVINVVKLRCAGMHNMLVTLLKSSPAVFTDLSNTHTHTHTHTSLGDSRYNHRFDTVTTALIRAVKETETKVLFFNI